MASYFVNSYIKVFDDGGFKNVAGDIDSVQIAILSQIYFVFLQ
jgi:hypothetical protein